MRIHTHETIITYITLRVNIYITLKVSFCPLVLTRSYYICLVHDVSWAWIPDICLAHSGTQKYIWWINWQAKIFSKALHIEGNTGNNQSSSYDGKFYKIIQNYAPLKLFFIRTLNYILLYLSRKSRIKRIYKILSWSYTFTCILWAAKKNNRHWHKNYSSEERMGDFNFLFYAFQELSKTVCHNMLNGTFPVSWNFG